MKKTVFEGKVNGQVFDNVNDYNACLQAMLDMGENVEASSSTKIVNMGDTCCEDEAPTKPLKASVNFLPGFETDNKSAYVDELVVVNDEEFDSVFDKKISELTDKYNEVRIAVSDPVNNRDKKKVYLDKVHKILGIIDQDYDKNLAAMDSVDEKLEKLMNDVRELELMKKTLMKADKVIQMYGDWYDSVSSVIQDNLDNACKCCCDGPCCGEEPPITTTEKVVEEPVSVHLGGFENLLKAVFGK